MNELRIGIFISIFIFFSLLEHFMPSRERVYTRRERWPANVGLILISNALIKFVTPISLFSLAKLLEINDFGLLNQFSLASTIELILSIVILDFFIYFQHFLFHKINFLWKIHRVHHTDIELDSSSALRFHSLEILISYSLKALLVCFLGIPPSGILCFEIILSSFAIFNHSNIAIPPKLEKYLRLIWVTPQMHLIHHSVKRKESDMNYGFNLSIWDRLFGTYLKKGEQNFKIGQGYPCSVKVNSLVALLVLPFKRKKIFN